MEVRQRLRTAEGRHPLAVDSALAAAIVVFTVVVPHPDAHGGRVPVAALALSGLAGLAQVARRVRPRTSFVVTVLTTSAAVVAAQGQPVYTIALYLAVYTAAVMTDRPATIRVFLAAFAALFAASAVVADALVPASQAPQYLLDATLSSAATIGIVAAVGDAVRSRRAYILAIEERAVRAEQSREEEARRRVVEERLRIARELHDVVAHHVAVVSVQAGVANHLMLKKPHAAQDALDHVQHASATILEELAGILNVLRQPEDSEAVSPPAPGLRELHRLVGAYVEAGLPVEVSEAGQPRALSDRVDLVAYRVLQEALTNAHKHGTDAAHVTVSYTPNSVVLEVVNNVRDPISTSRDAGYGVQGMRERAAAVGGELQVGGDRDGKFRVRLTLPATAGTS